MKDEKNTKSLWFGIFLVLFLIHGFGNLQYGWEDSEGEPEDEDTGDEDRDRFDEADENGDGVVNFSSVLCGELATDFVDGGSSLTGGDNLDEVLGEYLEIRVGFFDTLCEFVSVLDLFRNFGDFLLKNSIITSLCSEIEGFDNRYPGLKEEWEGWCDADDDIVTIHGPDDWESEVKWVESIATESATWICLEKENCDDNNNDNGDEIIFDESTRPNEGLRHEWEFYARTLEKWFEFGDNVSHNREYSPNEEHDDDERVGESSFYFGLEFLGVSEFCGKALERTLHGSGLFSGLDDGDFSSVENTWELLHRDTETVPGFYEDKEIHNLCLELRIFILVKERPKGCDNRYTSIDHIGEMFVEEGLLFWRNLVPKSNLLYLWTDLIVHSDE